MNCPKCGFDQPEGGNECARCGIVLAKARRAPPAPAGPVTEFYSPAPAASAAQSDERNPRGVWFSLALVVIVIGLVAGSVMVARGLRKDVLGELTRAAEASAPEAPGQAQAAAAGPGSAPAQPAQGKTPARPPVDFEMLLLTTHPENGAVKTSYPVWHENIGGYQQAVRERGPELAPMMVYFYTDWCPHCKYVNTVLWPDPGVAASLDHVVKVRINSEASEAEEALERQYGRPAIPTCYFHAAGEAAYKMINCGDPMTPADFSGQMTGLLSGGASLKVADTLRKQRRLPEALATANRVMEARSDDAEAFLFRGYIYHDMGKDDAAERDYLNAIKLDPHNIWSYRGLDEVWLKQGRPLDVVAAWSHFLQFEPRSGEGYLERAGTWQHAGDMAHVREDLQKGCTAGEKRACRHLEEMGPAPAANG
jgi:tetratricopeptide (TPR) repeat protein